MEILYILEIIWSFFFYTILVFNYVREWAYACGEVLLLFILR